MLANLIIKPILWAFGCVVIAEMLNVDLTWQVILLIVVMGMIDKMLDMVVHS
jgi:hypothetical protein